MNLRLRAKQTELRVGRRFEFIIRIQRNAGWMIDGDQTNLIEVRHLMQFFGDVDLVFAIYRLQSRAWNLDILIVVHREVVAIA